MHFLQRLGIEEDEVLKAILAKEDSSEIRKEVEKIVAWISFETGRNSFKHKSPLASINVGKFPSWYLGIRSSNNPVEIMFGIYQTLKEMNFEWQKISPYNLIVRPKSTEESVEKVSMHFANIHPLVGRGKKLPNAISVQDREHLGKT